MLGSHMCVVSFNMGWLDSMILSRENCLYFTVERQTTLQEVFVFYSRKVDNSSRSVCILQQKGRQFFRKCLYFTIKKVDNSSRNVCILQQKGRQLFTNCLYFNSRKVDNSSRINTHCSCNIKVELHHIDNDKDYYRRIFYSTTPLILH